MIVDRSGLDDSGSIVELTGDEVVAYNFFDYLLDAGYSINEGVTMTRTIFPDHGEDFYSWLGGNR